MFNYFWQGLVLGFTAAAVPGPLQAFLLNRALQRGWRRTLPAAFAPLLSDGPIIVLILFVLSALTDTMLTGIRFVGAAFLLYLAWGAFQSYRNYVPPTELGATAPADQTILKAVTINWLNPNPYIYWSTVGCPILLAAWQISPSHSLAFLAGMYLTLIGGFMAFIVLVGVVGMRFGRILTLISAIALVAFALYQLLQ